MATTVALKRLLDRKQWEMVNFAPTASTAGSFSVSSSLHDQYQFFVFSATSAFLYDPFEDGWAALPSPGLAGTFGAGSCGCRHPWGPRGFATAGTTTTLTTNINLQRSLKGYKVRILAGPNAGGEFTIASNTTGTNSVVTFVETAGTAFTTASEYLFVTGRVWVVNGGTLAAGSFKMYDLATNVWSNATQTGLPATIGTDAKLVPTPGYYDDFVGGTSGTATSTGSNTTTTLNDTAKAWTVNNWANYQVRIATGTGAGQIRTIASNTATALTVSTAWTITPDATSTYVIEGNSDYLYFLGNNAVTMYRYSISGNTWTTLAPTVARAGAPVAGMSANWVYEVSSPDWNKTTGGAYLNGRYIYSFRGGSTTLDRYDIAANTWENDIAYAPKAETLASGCGYCYYGDYINIALTSTGRFMKYNIAEQRMEPLSQLFYGQGTIVLGDRFFDVDYTDGGTTLKFLYFMTHTQATLFRTLNF